MSSMCLHNMVNFGPLTAELCWRVWGTPANLNGFYVLPSLLQRCCSPEAKQTARCLAISWAATLYKHFPGSCPWQNFARCRIHFTSKSCVLVYCQRYFTALQQPASVELCGVVQGMELPKFSRGRHLCSAGRTSRWTSTHILVMVALCNRADHNIFIL